jgi:hypothetical protein
MGKDLANMFLEEKRGSMARIHGRSPQPKQRQLAVHKLRWQMTVMRCFSKTLSVLEQIRKEESMGA